MTASGALSKIALMRLKMEIKYKNGATVSDEPVEISCEEGFTLKERTDRDGMCELEVNSKFIYHITVAGQRVRDNWWIENKESAEERFQIEETVRESAQQNSKDDTGLKGRLFYSDGTAVNEQLRVEVELSSQSIRVETTCKADGRFDLQMPYEVNEPLAMYVRGNKIDSARINYPGHRYAVVVLPPMMGKKGGDNGGLITGRVVDSVGDPHEGAKVKAQVVSSSLMGFMSGSSAEAESNRWGYFALEFDKGTEVKNLTVDGNDPLKVTRKRKDGEEVEVKADRYKAGSFGLTLVRRKKILGLW